MKRMSNAREAEYSICKKLIALIQIDTNLREAALKWSLLNKIGRVLFKAEVEQYMVDPDYFRLFRIFREALHVWDLKRELGMPILPVSHMVLQDMRRYMYPLYELINYKLEMIFKRSDLDLFKKQQDTTDEEETISIISCHTSDGRSHSSSSL